MPDYHAGTPLDHKYHTGRFRLAEKLVLARALKSELGAIQHICKITAEALQDAVPPTPGIAKYLARCLTGIYLGYKADEAFGIKRRRGQKDNREAQARNYFLADQVERFIYVGDVTLDEAVDTVAEKYGKNANTVKKAWNDNHKEARRCIKLEVKWFGKDYPRTDLSKVMPIFLP